MSKWLLLQIASPDAIMRHVADDKENSHLQDIYFIHQEHSSLAELLSRIEPSNGKTLVLQVTYISWKSTAINFIKFFRLQLMPQHYLKMKFRIDSGCKVSCSIPNNTWKVRTLWLYLIFSI